MFLQAHFEFRSQARKNVIEAWGGGLAPTKYEPTSTENSTYLSVISLTDSVSAFNLIHSHSLLIFSSCFPLHSRHIAKNRERSILYCRRKKSRKRFQDKNKYLRDPIGTVFPKSKCASLVSCSVMAVSYSP